MWTLLVKYLRSKPHFCDYTVAPATLLVFILLLNNFIEAKHQHKQQYEHQNNLQIPSWLVSGLRADQVFGIVSTNQKKLGLSMVTTVISRSARAKRGVESFASGAFFEGSLFINADKNQQGKQMFDSQDVDRGEIQPTTTKSVPVPTETFVERSQAFAREQSENSQATSARRLPRRTILHPSKMINDHQHSGGKEDNSISNRLDGTIKRQQKSSSLAGDSQRAHLQRQQREQVSSATAIAPTRVFTNDLTGAASNRTSNGGSKRAASDLIKSSVAASITKTITTSTITTANRPFLNDQDGSLSTRASVNESQWISNGVASKNTDTGIGPEYEPKVGPQQQAMVRVSYQATSASLDHRPAQMSPPLLQPLVSDGPSGWLDLQQLGSHVDGAADPYFAVRVQPLLSVEYLPRFPVLGYGLFKLGTHHHDQPHIAHHHNHHHHMHEHHHHHYLPHRSPKFQSGPQPLPMMRMGKIYKRVLMCDKTLISMDYIGRFHLEPGSWQPGGQSLNEHEINKINDNFLNLETSLGLSMTRLSSPLGANSNDPSLEHQSNLNANSTNASSGPNDGQSITISGAISNTTLEASAPEESEKIAANETIGLGRPAVAVMPNRRLRRHHNLLSEEDPLVRCDMWDLEMGLKSRKPPEAILRLAIKADFDTVRGAINRCRQLSERTASPTNKYRADGAEIISTEDLISLFSIKRGLVPGTKWCGLGDQATSYNDLGPKQRIDICCRAHDHCPIRSKPFRKEYGVLNIGLYTKSHCDCDADFYQCLRGIGTQMADMLGNLYFNIMKLQCMHEDRRKVCRDSKPIALGLERCVRYEDSALKTVFKFITPPVAY